MKSGEAFHETTYLKKLEPRTNFPGFWNSVPSLVYAHILATDARSLLQTEDYAYKAYESLKLFILVFILHVSLKQFILYYIGVEEKFTFYLSVITLYYT